MPCSNPSRRSRVATQNVVYVFFLLLLPLCLSGVVACGILNCLPEYVRQLLSIAIVIIYNILAKSSLSFSRGYVRELSVQIFVFNFSFFALKSQSTKSHPGSGAINGEVASEVGGGWRSKGSPPDKPAQRSAPRLPSTQIATPHVAS